MKLYRFAFIIILPFLVSCEYDYDFGGEFTPSVVINSTITPDSTIKVYLHWSQHVDDTSDFKRVERFTAQIYEDGILLPIDEYGVDGLFSSTTRKPNAGSQYRLEIDVPDYGRLSAETSIPAIPTIELEYTTPIEGSQYHFFNLKKTEPNATTRSVMVRVTGIYEGGGQELPWGLYADNSFCDQFNAYKDVESADYTGSSVSYEEYIRIPYKNIEQAMPLKFSAGFNSIHEESILDPDLILGYTEWGQIIIGYDDLGYAICHEDYIRLEYTHMRIKVISPSDDYDKFYKSAYIHDSPNSGGVYIGPFPIHSNVENGLGCFMGYSSATETYEVKYDE